jgi:L-ribulose-5-phosphate 3-epimerase
MNHRIAFNTANLVARQSGYRFQLSNWGEQHQLTAKKTDEQEFAAICAEIAAAGYRAVEIWQAHIEPHNMTPQRAQAFAKILAEHRLQPIGMAGSLDENTARVCRDLGIPAANGGFRGPVDAVEAIAAATGVAFNFENHPEPGADAIRQKIDGGRPHVGVCIDTGWLGTQGVDAEQAIRELGPLVRHVHLKDVRAAGAHETCPLGEGVVDVPAVIRVLREISYDGWYSWEDEPEDRNPMEIAAEMRRWIERQLDA